MTTSVPPEKDAAASSRASEEQLRLLVDGLADQAMHLLDVQDSVIAWSRGAERTR